MVGQLKVHGGRRALAVDFDLEGVQGRLAGLGGEAHGQARVDGRQAGSVGGDGALCCGEIRGQGVGGEIGRGGEGGHLALQRRDGGGVGADVGGVGRVFRLRGVRCEDGGELPGGDALQLDDRRGRFAVVQDPPGECAWKEGHDLLYGPRHRPGHHVPVFRDGGQLAVLGRPVVEEEEALERLLRLLLHEAVQ